MGKGQICILDIDIQGAKSIKERKLLPNAKYVFICPPVLDELERRIRSRGADGEEMIKKRLQTAKTEMDFLEANPDFFDFVMVNNDLGIAARGFLSQLRSWYPSLTTRMKVTAQKNT